MMVIEILFNEVCNLFGDGQNAAYLKATLPEAEFIFTPLTDTPYFAENTCWLYDCDYRPLADPSIKQVIFGGPRCRDHVVCAQLAGVSLDKIQITEDSSATATLIDPKLSKNIFVLHDLYRPVDAANIKNTLIKMGNGEV